MLCLVLLALLPTAFAIDCAAEGDGVHEMGCRAFVTCRAGVATVTECKGNTVYDGNTGTCADPNTLSNLCSRSKDCSVLSDGKYADPDCSTYYTCYGGTYFGHNYCPGGTVFNEALQACDWSNDTPPPCGTKGQSTAARAKVADAVNCSTLNDGVYEKSCRSFTVCHDGKPEVKFCHNGLVFNSETGICNSPSAVAPPCGVSRDCTGKDDGVYVDDGCRSYYTCMGEIFFGHDLCPESLVYNQDLKTCDWPNHVAPPCGTRH